MEPFRPQSVRLPTASSTEPPNQRAPDAVADNFQDFTDIFDGNEPTMARFGARPAQQNMGSMSSTPFHGLAPPPAAFFNGATAASKPWERGEGGCAGGLDIRDPFQVEPGVADFNPFPPSSALQKEEELFIPRPTLPSTFKPPPQSCAPSQECGEPVAVGPSQQGVQPPEAEKEVVTAQEGAGGSKSESTVGSNERRLSIIQESSREFRSGSTSCSSASSVASSEVASARKRAISSYAVTPAPLQIQSISQPTPKGFLKTKE